MSAALKQSSAFFCVLVAKKAVWLLAGLVLLEARLPAQPGNPDKDLQAARELANRAEVLARSGERQRAFDLVSQQLLRNPSEPKPSRALLYSELAWLYHDGAAAGGPLRPEYLLQSSNYYQQVLNLYPNHAEAAENFSQVLRELGHPAAAITWLDRTLTNQTFIQTYPRLIAIGDSYSGLNQPKKAMRVYEQAFQYQTDDDRAPWRMVSLYSAVPDRWAKELFDFCQRFTTAGLSQVAVRGYECLIAKTNQAGELLQIIGNSAEAWVELESQMGTLSPASLRRLPSSAVDRSKALSELRPWIENPPGPDFVYWQGSFLRRHIAASALRALAQYQRINGQPNQAVSLYQKSLSLAPPYYTYTEELRDRPIVGLDVALDLAALFQAFPRLDPKGDQFRKLEDELLEEKTMAYVQKNLVAVQKFHTVLGVIYAERGRWGSGDWRAAPYHLERAVSTAQTLAQRQPSEYKPLPHLTQILAEGLTTNSHPNLPYSHQLYLDSAQGYLDNDDLISAGKVLKKATSLPVQKTNELRYLELKQILDTRQGIRALQLKDYQSGAPGTKASVGTNQWARLASAQSLDPVFLQRQHVRALNDLSTRAQKVGASAQAQQLNEAAFRQLKAAPGATHEDLRRLVESPIPSNSPQSPRSNLIPARKELRPNQQILKASDLVLLESEKTNAAAAFRPQ